MQNILTFLKKNAIGIAMFFIVVALFFLFRYIFSFSFIFHDDLWYAILDDNNNVFFKSENGNHIASFLNRLFGSYIPLKIGMHPSAFKREYFSYIQSGIFLIFIYFFSKLLFIKRRKNYMFPLCFLFSAAVFFLCFTANPYLFFNYDGIFRVTMPVFLFSVFMYYFLKSLEDNTIKNKILVSTFCLLCCITSETLSIAIPTGTILYILISLIRKRKIPNPYILTLILSICGVLILVLTGTYTRKSSEINYFADIIVNLKDFSVDYIKYVFANHIIEFFLIILQSVVLIIKLPDKRIVKEYTSTIYCFLFGILFFFASLIVLGQTFVWADDGDTFWVAHQDLKALLSSLLWIFNFVLLNLILRFNLIKENILAIFMAIVLIIMSLYNVKIYKYYIFDDLFYKRMSFYKVEKAIRLAELQNRPAILDKEIINSSTYFYNSFIRTAGVVYNDTKLSDDMENIVIKVVPFCEFYSHFGLECSHGIIFADKKTADKDYKDNGGIYSINEIRNPDFEKLKDNDFVLGKKKTAT